MHWFIFVGFLIILALSLIFVSAICKVRQDVCNLLWHMLYFLHYYQMGEKTKVKGD